MKQLNTAVSLFLLLISANAMAAERPAASAPWYARVSEIDRLVQQNITAQAYPLPADTKKNWDLKRDKLLAQGVPLITNELQGVGTLQAWLSEAGLGAQALLTKDSAEAAWLGVASDGWPAKVLSGGLVVKRQGMKWYVDQVLRKSSAELGGWKRGALLDITAISCTPTECKIPRQVAMNAKLETKTLNLKGVKPLSEALYNDTEASEQMRAIVIPQVVKPVQVGYARWFSASPAHGEELWRSIASRMQASADVWLLDFRGGAQDDSADLAQWFFFQEKSGKAATKPLYTKPLAILVDGSTCGARERFALIAQAQNRAVLIGHETCGRPWAVTWKPLKEWAAWLAWPEAFPQKPLTAIVDFQVPSDVSFTEGQDSALEAAWQLMAQIEFEPKKPD